MTASSLPRRLPYPFFWFLTLGIVAADQFSKFWITASLRYGESIPVFGDWFHFTLVRNDGMAMGLFQGRNTLLLGLVGLILLAAVFGARKIPWALREINFLAALILGGAVGNLIDRIRVGHVIDFIDITIIHFRWWTFNIADSAISIAVVWILIRSWSPRFGQLPQVEHHPKN
ncbi:MAG: signal peptidase II [Candidatus Methylacidiphilales bacterium]